MKNCNAFELNLAWEKNSFTMYDLQLYNRINWNSFHNLRSANSNPELLLFILFH